MNENSLNQGRLCFTPRVEPVYKVKFVEGGRAERKPLSQDNLPTGWKRSEGARSLG